MADLTRKALTEYEAHGATVRTARLLYDALAAEKARAEQAEHTAGQLRTALTESRSVWKARAEQAERERGSLRDESIEMEEAWERATERAVIAERVLSDLRAAVKAKHDEWSSPPVIDGYDLPIPRSEVLAFLRRLAETDADNGGGEGQ